MTAPLQGIATLTHLGVIRAQGADAANFLHGQLTQDFALLDTQHARLAAYCSAKGRMLASFIGFKTGPEEILLLCSQDLLPAMLKRLSMFVLRAKCKLSDATADFALYGLAGDSATQATGNAAPWTLRSVDAVHVVQLYPAGETPRALWVAPAGSPLPAGPALDSAAWLWSEVASGIATLSLPVQEQFVPQMLNYESVGGVNFKKGCYPGQEVVARSQFRGTLKRRAYIVHAEQPLTVGAEVFAASDAEQPVGMVVQSAAAPAGGFDAIVSLQIASTDEALNAGGVALALQPLPYELLADI
ncbi:folate-binding protein [Comamonas sp. CMM03]|uniref:CAF17-like 4Fe-4S cluster assembly/insertion protein YgfZ n=1 Tax=Comamonas sp. CMM03 TaxID=2854781 RepID=UPI001C43D398|nr:folate-binding protein [Comamonas sp. CMM03]MBV7417455.1 folate-binding protein [Comamonas sp. CMM03]